jgi:hypothetical protein
MAANTLFWDAIEREGTPSYPSASVGPDEAAAAKRGEKERERRSTTLSKAGSEMSFDQRF